MEIKNKSLKRRIIEISYPRKLSHLGSALTAVDIIDEIFSKKKKDEKFVLSSGHAALALYVVNEKYKGIDAEFAFNHHGVHPDRCFECALDCSAGSLGNGLPIAVGMALADRSKNVYCLISDGEYSEGSIHESINIIAKENIDNLKVYANFNGWGAYRKTETYYTGMFLGAQGFKVVDTNCDYIPFLKGQQGHYKMMNEEEYKLALDILK